MQYLSRNNSPEGAGWVLVHSLFREWRISAMSVGVMNGLKDIKSRISSTCSPTIDELLRSFMMVFILRPSALLLPRDIALAIARWCGSVMLRIPSSGKSALRMTQKAFQKVDAEARRSAEEYLAQPFCSFVVFERILHNRENLNDWKVEEKNAEAVAALRESGRPFILAGGHFRRDSFIAIYMRRFSPGSVATVSLPVPRRSFRPSSIRMRIQFGQLLKVIQHTRPENKFVYVGGASTVREILKHLEAPGHELLIAIDAFWKTGGWSAHLRPFAGMRCRPFSVGSAALSRLARCPIVTFASYIAKDGTIVLEWGPVIPAPEYSDEAADRSNANIILDFLENEIGLRPSQYTLYIGEERRWNPDLQIWEDPDREELRSLETTAGIRTC